MSNDEKKIQISIQFSATTSLSLKNFLNDCHLEVEPKIQQTKIAVTKI